MRFTPDAGTGSCLFLQIRNILTSSLCSLIMVSRNVPYAGIDRAPPPVSGDPDAKSTRDGTAELMFPDQVWKSGYVAPEDPNPFTPEQHALDIAVLVWLYMPVQELIEDPEFPGLFRTEVDSTHAEQVAEPFRPFGFRHVGWGRIEGVTPAFQNAWNGELSRPKDSECCTGSCCLSRGHGKSHISI